MFAAAFRIAVRPAVGRIAMCQIPCRYMAGHNKWSKIKRDKGVNDAQRSKLFTKLARELACALRDAKGNVDDSKVLAALQKAKINGMPKANIDRVLNQKSADEKSEVCFVEAIGPGGTYLLIECLTDSRIRTQTELRKIMSKNGGMPATVKYDFNKKGVVTVRSTIDQALEAAILAGGEDVQPADDDGMVKVLCEFSDLTEVKESLAQAGIEVHDYGYDYIPNTWTNVQDGEESDKLSHLLGLLEDHVDVLSVYNNAAG